MSKIALVTGANKGIGLETARQLAKAGVHVILAARDRAKLETAVQQLKSEALDVEGVALDVTDRESIAAAVAAVGAKHGHLDILINNAGVGIHDGSRRVSGQTMETWRKTFDTNLFGLIEVTQGFLPLLHKSEAARIVNLTSVLGSIAMQASPKSPIYTYKTTVAYNVSKTAVNAWTVHLAYELRDTKMKVNAAHPGHVKTEMGGANAPMEIVDGAKTSVALALLGPDGPSGAFVHLGQTLPW